MVGSEFGLENVTLGVIEKKINDDAMERLFMKKLGKAPNSIGLRIKGN